MAGGPGGGCDDASGGIGGSTVNCGQIRAALARSANIYGFIKPRDKDVETSRQDRQIKGSSLFPMGERNDS